MFAGFKPAFFRSGLPGFARAKGRHKMIVRVWGLIACKVSGFIFRGVCGWNGKGEAVGFGYFLGLHG